MPPKQLSRTEDWFEALLDSRVVEALAKALSPLISLTIDEALGKRMEVLSTTIKELKAENVKLNSVCESVVKENAILKQTIEEHSRRIDDMEVYGRSSDIIIKGLPEKSASEMATSAPSLDDHSMLQESHESVAQNVIKFCKDALGVALLPQDITVAHRLKPGQRDTVRPIIVRFVNRQVRNTVYRAKKELKNSRDRIFITEHLTKKNSDLFYEARKLLRERKIFATWTHNGLVHVRFSADPSVRATVIKSRQDLNLRDGS